MFPSPRFRVSPASVCLALATALWASVLLLAGPASAQLQVEEKAKVTLAPAQPAYAPGSTARLAAVLDIEETWHTNSHRPTLDYLIPTEAKFEVSEGWPIGQVTFPEGVLLPFAFVEEPISVYEGQVSIVAEVDVPASATPGPVPVAVAVTYQACNDSTCLPPVTSRAEGILTVAAAAAVPAGGPEGIAPLRSGRSEPTMDAGTTPGEARLPGAGGATGTGADEGAGEATDEGNDGELGAGLLEPPEAETTTAPSVDRGLLGILFFAFLGGLILNVMPCVLPVLSLKVFGIAESAGKGRAEARTGGLMTTLGILVSFWALAAAAIAARAAGHAVGWGVQFQEPGFVTFLAVIVVLFSLNLWGLFEIPLPARLANRLAGGQGHTGAAGHFASGLFATLMATPCSAPFLGTAISFALIQPPVVIVGIFTAVGLGLALPYLVLAAWPGAARLFPKPGAWMETVRGVLGFLLAAAAIWLFFVLASQLDPARLAWVQFALLLLALGVWIASRRGGVAAGLKAFARVGAVAAAVWAIYLAATAAPVSASTQVAGKLIQWQTFDRAQAEQLAAEGTPVFVDVTANWCVTCKVVERGVLETEEIATAFERHGVVPMKADWTNYDRAIGDFLQEHGRAGIPFYLLYRPGTTPYLFSELPTKKSILAALEDLG